MVGGLGEIVGGGTPSRNNVSYWNGAIPWVTPSEITQLPGKYIYSTVERISQAGLAGSAARLLPENSIVVTTRATLGEAAITAVPLATNQGFKNIIPDTSSDPRFTYYAVKTLRREMERLASGTTFLEISKADFERISLMRPLYGEQERVAAILGILDSAIEQTEAVIAKLKQVRAGLLNDLLTRFLKFGKDAKGSSLVPLTQIVDVNPHSQTRNFSSETLVSFVPMSDVSDFGEWTHRQAKTIGSIGNGYTAFQEGDVLFAKITPCMENGKGMLAQGLANGIGLGSTEFHVLRPKQGINPKLIFHVLQAAIVRQKAIAFMSGSAGQQRVQAEYFGQLHLPQLSAEEQAVIIGSLDAMDDEIRALADELVKLQAINTGLTDDLLTGRVRVPAELEMA